MTTRTQIRFLQRLLLACALAGGAIFPQVSVKPSSAPPMDYRDIATVKSIRGLLSPSGEIVLAVVQEKDLAGNRILTRTWRVPFSGAEPVPFTSAQAGDRDFQWTPDGRAVSFLGTRNNAEGLYLMRIDGGDPELLLKHETGITAYRWRPDGRVLAFTAPEAAPAGEDTSGKGHGEARLEDAAGPAGHLWIFDPEAKKEYRVTKGDVISVLDLAWSPDGGVVAFSAAPSARVLDFVKSDVYVVSIPAGFSGSGLASPRRLTTNPGEDTSPRFAPDGRSILYRSRAADDLVGSYHWCRISPEGGTPSDVTPKGDISSLDFQFGSDSSAVYFVGYRGVEADVYRMDLNDRVPVGQTSVGGVCGSLSLSRDGSRMVFTSEAPDRPQEIFALSGAGASPRALTAFNRTVRNFALAKTEVRHWPGAGGRTIEGLLVYPARHEPGRSYPLIVQLHGGPAGLDAKTFDAEAQYLAGLGYFLFRPNYRGSAGYGDAFRRLNVGDWGGGDVEDVLRGVDSLAALPDIDRGRIAVMGWSYGGYLTARLVSLSSIFKAAVVGAGFEDNLSMWGTQDSPPHFAAYFGGNPFERELMKLYRVRSPLEDASSVKTPVLLLHGENDTRVPPSQAVLFYRALQANRVPSELVWYPHMGHAPQDPGQQLDILQRQAAWFSRYLGGREMQLWKEPFPNNIPPLPKADATHRFVTVPYDFEHPGWGTLRLYYETNTDFDPAKPTLMHILDGQSPQFAAGAPDRMKKDYGLNLNIVQIEHRGMPASPAPLVSAGGRTDWVKACAVFRSANVVRDIDAVRRDLLGPEGRIRILGQSGGAILACQYLAEFGRSVDRAIIERGTCNLTTTIARNKAFFFDELKGQGVWDAYLRILDRKPVPTFQFLWLLSKLGYDYAPADGMQARLIRELDEGNLASYEALGRKYGLVDSQTEAIITFAPFAVVRLFEVFFPVVDAHPVESSYGLMKPLFAPLSDLIAQGVVRPKIINLEKEMTGIQAETMILASRWDHVVAYEDSLELGRIIPHSRVIVFDDTHLMLQNRTCRYHLVKAFLEGGLAAAEIDRVLGSGDCHIWEAGRQH